MSKWNIFAAFLLGAAMFAGPAAADGKTKRYYKPGPTALNITCPTGYTKDKHDRCVRTVTPRAITTCPQGYTKTTNGQCVRQVTQTRPVPRPAPRPVPQPRPAPVQQVSLDLGSFTGGVGAGIDSGFYGGNGFIPIGPSRSFSGVLDAPAAAFTFNRRAQTRTRGRSGSRSRGGHGYKGGGGCRC